MSIGPLCKCNGCHGLRNTKLAKQCFSKQKSAFDDKSRNQGSTVMIQQKISDFGSEVSMPILDYIVS